MSRLYVPSYEEMAPFPLTIANQKYAWDTPDGKENWGEIALRVAKNVGRAVGMNNQQIQRIANMIANREFIPGGRYLYASGRPYHQVQNCLLLRAEDSREGWSELMGKITQALMTGAGIGVVYSDLRGEGKVIRRTGGFSTGPIALAQMVNEAGRGIMQGGSRRAAIWAGLHWNHPDIFKFIRLKDWSPEVRALKEKDFNFPATMDMTNISVILDDEFFAAINNEKHKLHAHASAVYWETVEHMLKTGEPGFSIDRGPNAGENLRNACTEITSYDDSDICNLGSINMARIKDLDHMKEVVELSTMFLLAGTVYSDVPYPKVDQIRTKNRRIGLGLMGLHEFLLKRGKKYGPDAELTRFLEVYRDVSDDSAEKWAQEWDISIPIKRRAIAPTGSIGIIAETTTGCEPIFCVAYKRRYLKHKTWNYQYVVDPTAARIIEQYGIKPEQIEDAYSLAENVERRVAFQAYLQQFVDHAISSTINLPAWGTELNNSDRIQDFGNMLLQYLPDLRGMTVYPDGARSGQPLVPVSYHTAKKHLGTVFTDEDARETPPTKGPDFSKYGHGSGKPTMGDLYESTGDAFKLSDEEAAMPVDICDLTRSGTCGS